MSPDDVVAVGYVLTQVVPRPPYMSAALLPDEIVSASDCICPRFPDRPVPDWCASAEEAIEARRDVLGDLSDVRVFGLGLPRRWVDAFVAAASEDDVCSQVARRGERLAAGARRLGFELLNVEVGAIDHSWLCNGLETHCADALGIRPNAHGLIETIEDAERCRAEIERDEAGSEPGPWFPFLLVEYA